MSTQKWHTHRIEMIRYLRVLTKVLGKLGIKELVHEYPPNVANLPNVYYGFGLKESKDCVERFLERKRNKLYDESIKDIPIVSTCSAHCGRECLCSEGVKESS